MVLTDLWNTLFGSETNSRIVIKTDSTEVDVKSVEHFAGLLVITPANELTDSTQACDDLYAAQVEIDELKREVLELTRDLYAAQVEIDELKREVLELTRALDEARSDE